MARKRGGMEVGRRHLAERTKATRDRDLEGEYVTLPSCPYTSVFLSF